jgi:hypothetical protein
VRRAFETWTGAVVVAISGSSRGGRGHAEEGAVLTASVAQSHLVPPSGEYVSHSYPARPGSQGLA